MSDTERVAELERRVEALESALDAIIAATWAARHYLAVEVST